MTIKNRLDKLEQPLSGDWCPHQPMRVYYEPDGSKPAGAEAANAAPEPEVEPCWCGLPLVVLRVIYGDEKAVA